MKTLLALLFLGGMTFVACSSDPPATPGGEDAAAPDAGPIQDASTGDAIRGDAGDAMSVDDAAADVGSDAACMMGTAANKTGETCVGFGRGQPCSNACGAFGYVCFNGGPPNLNGCREMRTSGLGNTYCCPDLACVRQPDQDNKCPNPRPQRYQCLDADAGAPMPPAGCQEDVAARQPGSRFFCCP